MSEHDCYVMNVDTKSVETVARDYILHNLECLDIDYNTIKLYVDYKYEDTIDFSTFIYYAKSSTKAIFGHTYSGDLYCYIEKGEVKGINVPVKQLNKNYFIEFELLGKCVYSILSNNKLYIYVDGLLYTVRDVNGITGIGHIDNRIVIVCTKCAKAVYKSCVFVDEIEGVRMSIREFKRRVMMGVLCSEY